jgi:2-C-methyl-D-erythritol 4-phosphate cytidylyltransferase
MNTALIFAGGTGYRMNPSTKPKQFLELHGKPVIMYTLEHFERHREIDKIVIVCLEGWIDELKHLFRIYDIRKVSRIVLGGTTGFESIFNGLEAMENDCKPDDIVLIHDGVRPLINAELISANIAKVKKHGTSITVEAATESVVSVGEGGLIKNVPPREEMFSAKAPQSFRYGIIWDLYQKAKKDRIATIDSAQLCSIYGLEMRTVPSTPNNIKITTPQDYYIFRALFEAMENQQILGL